MHVYHYLSTFTPLLCCVGIPLLYPTRRYTGLLLGWTQLSLMAVLTSVGIAFVTVQTTLLALLAFTLGAGRLVYEYSPRGAGRQER